MADPLTETADRFAPAPTNYFDKGQAASIKARYSNARAEAESSQGVVDAARNAQALRSAALSEKALMDREAREKLMQTREDKQYTEQQDAREMRAQFLEEMDADLDPSDPEYNSRVTEFLSAVPPALQEDPVFRGMLEIRNRRADKALDQRMQTEEIGLRQKNAKELIDARAKRSTLLSNLTEEDRRQAPLDETGSPDLDWLYSKAAERKRENELKTDAEKVGIRKAATLDILSARNASVEDKERILDVKNVVINDSEAFPNRIEALAPAWMKKFKMSRPPTEDDLKKDMPNEFAAAKEWNAKKFENEVLTARKYDNPEDYIEFTAPDGKPARLSPAAVESRRKLWEAAQLSKPGGESVTQEVTEKTTETVTETPEIAKPVPVKKVINGYEYWREDGVLKKQKVAQ